MGLRNCASPETSCRWTDSTVLSVFAVVPGDVLTLEVGGGGQGAMRNANGGAGGWPDGGSGAKGDQGSGGGGGSGGLLSDAGAGGGATGQSATANGGSGATQVAAGVDASAPSVVNKARPG